MSLLKKVAMVVIAVVLFQTPYTGCQPKSEDENPFARYVGNKRHGKITRNSNFIKSPPNFSGPGEKFINPVIYKSNLPLGKSQFLNSAHASSSKKYDPVLLESFKKEARRKRKSKKHMYENIALAPSQSTDIQSPVFVTAGGSFPEMEYPLSAIETWVPKYWNTLPYNTDDAFLKQNDLSSPSHHVLPTTTNAYKTSSNTKYKMKSVNVNNNKVKGETKSSKLIAPPNIKNTIAKDISQSLSSIAYSPGLQIDRKNSKLMKTPGFISKINNKETISNLRPQTVFSIASAESKNLNNSKITNTVDASYQNINTVMSNTKQYGGAERNVVSYIQLSSNTDNGFNITQTKLVSDECPSNVICSTQVQSIVSDISDNYTHDALLSSHNVLETNPSNNVKMYQDSTQITQLDNDTVSKQNLEIVNGENMLPKDEVETQKPLFLLSSYLSNVTKLKDISSSKVTDLAEKVLAQLSPLPKEYELPTDFTLPQILSPNIMTRNKNSSENIPGILNVTTGMYSQNGSTTLSDLNKLYILVDEVLDIINSQQNGIPNDALLEIISRIDSLSTNYTKPGQITDLVEIIPTEYGMSNSASKSYQKSENIRQKTNVNEKSYDVEDSSRQSIAKNPPQINKSENNNNSLPFCPLPTMDQCSINEQSGAESLYNNTLYVSNIMVILTGQTFENTSEYNESIAKERLGVYKSFNQPANNIFHNETSDVDSLHKALTDDTESDKSHYKELITSPEVSTNKILSTLPDQDVRLFEPFLQDKATLTDAQDLFEKLIFGTKQVNSEDDASIGNSSDNTTDIIGNCMDQNTTCVKELFPKNKVSNTELPVSILTKNISKTDYDISKETFSAQEVPMSNNVAILINELITSVYDLNGKDKSPKSVTARDDETSPEIISFEIANTSALLAQKEPFNNGKISELPYSEVLPVSISLDILPVKLDNDASDIPITDVFQKKKSITDCSETTLDSLDAYKSLPETFVAVEVSQSLKSMAARNDETSTEIIVFKIPNKTDLLEHQEPYTSEKISKQPDSEVLSVSIPHDILPVRLDNDASDIPITDVFQNKTSITHCSETTPDSLDAYKSLPESFVTVELSQPLKCMAARNDETSSEIIVFEIANKTDLLEQREPFTNEKISELPDSEVLPVPIPLDVLLVKLDNDASDIPITEVFQNKTSITHCSETTPDSLDAFKSLPETFVTVELLQPLKSMAARDDETSSEIIVFEIANKTDPLEQREPFTNEKISELPDSEVLPVPILLDVLLVKLDNDASDIPITDVFQNKTSITHCSETTPDSLDAFKSLPETFVTVELLQPLKSMAARDDETSSEIIVFEIANKTDSLEQREPFTNEKISELPDSEVLPVSISLDVLPVKLDNDASDIPITDVFQNKTSITHCSETTPDSLDAYKFLPETFVTVELSQPLKSMADRDDETSSEIIVFEISNITDFLEQREPFIDQKISELPDSEVLPVSIPLDILPVKLGNDASDMPITEVFQCKTCITNCSVTTPCSFDAYKSLPEDFVTVELLASPYVHDLPEISETGATQIISDDDIPITFDSDISSNASFDNSNHNNVTSDTSSSESRALIETKIFTAAVTTDNNIQAQTERLAKDEKPMQFILNSSKEVIPTEHLLEYFNADSLQLLQPDLNIISEKFLTDQVPTSTYNFSTEIFSN